MTPGVTTLARRLRDAAFWFRAGRVPTRDDLDDLAFLLDEAADMLTGGDE